MKDLKHLYYFEKLLEDANNELVRRAQADGDICVGNTCYQLPEVLMDLPGTFTVRLRAPKTVSMDMGTYYMTSMLCDYSRALLERAIEGGYNFLDCLMTPDGCTMINRCVENMELLKVNEKEKFFYKYLEVPLKADDNGLTLLVSECRKKILGGLKEGYGIDTSDVALRKAVEKHNEICRIITEIGNFRKDDIPRISGYEFHIICMVSFVCPKYLIIDKLRETLEELKIREPDKKFQYRTRVVVVGSEVDDVDMIKLIESSGAYVCADRFCFGSLPGRQEIILNDKEDVLTQICRHYMLDCMCPRHMDTPKMNHRREYVDEIAKEYKADGIIYQQLQFCDPWAYERMIGAHVLHDEYNYPVLTIDRPYSVGVSGLLKTRVQAFVESIEIKKIQGEKK